jgi:hypothetical protein
MRERYNSTESVRPTGEEPLEIPETRKAFFLQHNGLDSAPSAPDNSPPPRSFAKSPHKAKLHALPGQTLRLIRPLFLSRVFAALR